VIALPVETPRLRIRPFDPAADAEPLHELWGDARAMRFIPGAAQATVEATRRRLESALERAPAGWGFWGLEEREGRLIGGAGVFPEAWEGPEFELAYHVVPSAWGRGYATEAGRALLEATWRETDLDRVVAFAFEDNVASTRVMRKLGMRFQGHVDYRGYDVVHYAIDRPA
jgi:[ribosomal protein S5]-alanine N-acetyltransferase